TRPQSGRARHLCLFRKTDPQLRVLSTWDQAFLRSLYTTSQSSALQVPMINHHISSESWVISSKLHDQVEIPPPLQPGTEITLVSRGGENEAAASACGEN